MAPKVPVWTSLGTPGGAHWNSLNHEYVPEGLLDLIASSPALVLDVGCFCGAVGAWLKRKYPEVRVVGIEPRPEAAREARARLDAVLEGRLEDVNLSGVGVRPGNVDVIVLADVLEHMYDPWHALLALRPLLTPKGVILASIPNIRHWTVLKQLVKGDFPYDAGGLLDITHIRFFTWTGIQRMFGETGFKIEEVRHTLIAGSESLLEALKMPSPINIDSPVMQLKSQTRDQIRDLVTFQYWLRACPA